jgi:pilus assembly protein Flp/PilA
MDKFVMKMYVALHTGLYTLREKADRERGATAVEYGLLVALIAAIIILTVAALGVKVDAAFQKVVTNMP